MIRPLDDSWNPIHFGAVGYDDYTTHHNPARKELYINRHSNEKPLWDKKVLGPAYFSRFLLWEKPDINAAIRYVEEDLGVKIKRTGF